MSAASRAGFLTAIVAGALAIGFAAGVGPDHSSSEPEASAAVALPMYATPEANPAAHASATDIRGGLSNSDATAAGFLFLRVLSAEHASNASTGVARVLGDPDPNDSVAAPPPAAPDANAPATPPADAAALARRLLSEDKWEEALAEAKRLTEADPNSAPGRTVLGDAHYRRGDFEEAEEAYRQAAVIDPNHAPAHFGIARILRTVGRYGEAAASYHKAASLDPANAKYVRTLANHLARRPDQIALLERYLEMPAAEDENIRRNVRAWIALLKEMGDEPLGEVVKSDPTELPLNVLKGQAYFKAGIDALPPQRFAFDTGATGITISPRVAKMAKLKPIRDFTITGMGGKGTVTGDLVVIRSLTVGGVALRNVTATVAEPVGPEEGLIGPSVFSSFLIGIDLDGATLSFQPHPPPSNSANSPQDAATPASMTLRVPFRNVGGQIIVKASINGTPLNAMVDTGASSSFATLSAVPRVPGLEVLPGSWASSGVGFGLGGAIPRKLLRSATLTFGGKEFRADGMPCADLTRFSRALESELYVVIGFPELSRFLVTIDYRTNTLTLTPRKAE